MNRPYPTPTRQRARYKWNRRTHNRLIRSRKAFLRNR